MSKFVTLLKKLNFKKIKLIAAGCACFVGVVIIIAVPAIFNGPTASANNSVSLTGNTETPEKENTLTLYFKKETAEVLLGADITDLLYISDGGVITNTEITGNCVTAETNPFKLTAAAEGTSTVKITAENNGKTITASIIINVKTKTEEDNIPPGSGGTNEEVPPKPVTRVYKLEIIEHSGTVIIFSFTADGKPEPYKIGYQFIKGTGTIARLGDCYIVNTSGNWTILFWAQDENGVKYEGTELSISN